MTIDADLVTRKMLLITSDLDLLRRIAESGLDAYLSSPMHQAAVERYLERVIGRMIQVWPGSTRCARRLSWRGPPRRRKAAVLELPTRVPGRRFSRALERQILLQL
jgi:hypothetical protein